MTTHLTELRYTLLGRDSQFGKCCITGMLYVHLGVWTWKDS